MHVNLSPAGAIRLWLDENRCIDIPPTEAGMKALCDVLFHAAQGETKVGQRGSLTQAQLDELVTRFKATRPKTEVEKLVEELDLDGVDI